MLHPSTSRQPTTDGRRRATIGATAVVIAFGSGLAVAAPSWAATGSPTYDYVVSGQVHETHRATAGDGEPLICAEDEIARYDGTFTVHLTSTVSGLTDAQVLAQLDAEPDGTVLHVAYDGVGTLVQRSGTHTYTTAYTDSYHGNLHGSSLGFHSTFIARGHSELGTRYSLVSRGSFVIANGEFHESRTPVQVKGCLP
jgi:hypothetical protein